MISFVLRDLRGSGRTLWILFACLLLGVTLIAASGGLLQQVRSGLLADTRTLFGGDVEVSQRAPLSEKELAWLRSQGRVSLLIELRTMLLTPDGRSQVVELQSFDDNYPLYGEVTLDPSLPLNQVLAQRDGAWGAAIDPVLAELPLAPTLLALGAPLAVAMLFGLLTALTFTLPALGRALAVTPAALFQGIDASPVPTPPRYRRLTLASGLLTAGLMVVALPQPLFGLGFLGVTLVLLALLEGVVRLLRRSALHLSRRQVLTGRFQWRLALANLYRPGAPLRPTLLSLGSALTLLVASTLVVAALLRTLNDTIPEQAPALIFYDVVQSQVDGFRARVQSVPTLERLDLAPLVLGRLSRVNGESLRESADLERALEARDEHKLSYRLNNFDGVQVERGAWWPENYQGPPRVAIEDREADQLGLEVGDRLAFTILGETVEADLAAIYGQRRFQSRFWLEGIFSDGVLDPFISRYVGAIYMDPAKAVDLQASLAAEFPNVVTVRTESVLREARALLARASSGLAVVAAISLIVSLLVLASVVAGSQARQVYDATVLHVLGARLGAIRRALGLEQALLGLLVSLFALVLGGIIAWGLLEYRLELEMDGIWWTALVVAPLVSGVSLGLGTRHLLRRLRPSPALLLRS